MISLAALPSRRIYITDDRASPSSDVLTTDDQDKFCLQTKGRGAAARCIDDGTGKASATVPWPDTTKAWTAVHIAQAGPHAITVDLSKLPAGAKPYAIRYAWQTGAPTGGYCCTERPPSSAPCPIGSCPLMSTPSKLPANPFLAKIVGDLCLAPQVCDELPPAKPPHSPPAPPPPSKPPPPPAPIPASEDGVWLFENGGNGSLFVPRGTYDGAKDGKNFVRNSNGNHSCALAWDSCEAGIAFDNGRPVWGSCCSALRVHGTWGLKTSSSGCGVKWKYDMVLSNRTYTAADGKVALASSIVYLEEAA